MSGGRQIQPDWRWWRLRPRETKSGIQRPCRDSWRNALFTADTHSAVSARRLSGLIPLHELSGYCLSQRPRSDSWLYLFTTYYVALCMDGPQRPASYRNQLTLPYDRGPRG